MFKGPNNNTVHLSCAITKFLDFSTLIETRAVQHSIFQMRNTNKSSRFPANKIQQPKKQMKFIPFHKDFVQTGQDQRTVNRQQVTSVFFMF